MLRAWCVELGLVLERHVVAGDLEVEVEIDPPDHVGAAAARTAPRRGARSRRSSPSRRPAPHSTHHSPGTATQSSWVATRSAASLLGCCRSEPAATYQATASPGAATSRAGPDGRQRAVPLALLDAQGAGHGWCGARAPPRRTPAPSWSWSAARRRSMPLLSRNRRVLGDVEPLARQALRRQLDDAEPSGYSHISATSRRRTSSAAASA